MQRANRGPKALFKCHFPLSWELVAYILLFADPIDIISMRKTSRNISKVTMSRLVWVAALDRVCDIHGIFKPTYPLEKMSLLELEYAALMPYRFVKMVKEHENTMYIPSRYQTRIPQLRLTPGPIAELHLPDKMALIPGGRFLLTTGQHQLHLWDLGYSVQKTIYSFPLATLTADVRSLRAVALTVDRKKLIVAVSVYKRTPTHEASLQIYRVNPRSETPVFRLVAELAVSDDPFCPIYLTANAAVLCSEEYISVWNWSDNTGCRWKAFKNPLGISVYACDGAVIACDFEPTLRVWDVPELFPLCSSPKLSDMTIVDNTPKFSTRMLHVESDITFSGTPVWQQTAFSDRYLCAMVDDENELGGDDAALSLFSIRPLASNGQTSKGDPFIPSVLPVLGAVGQRIFGHDHMDHHQCDSSPLSTCNDHLVFCAESDSNSIVATVLPTPKKASDGKIDTWSMSLTPEEEDLDPGSIVYAFCPMSGRLVHCALGGSREGEVCVTDFLSPPRDM